MKGYAIKIVNPGGVENWKYGGNVYELDDEVIGFGVRPRDILQALAWINDELALPHLPHIHGINLGTSRSGRTTVESMRILDGLPAHFCHLQFLSYREGLKGIHRSDAAAVAEAVNELENITVDVGQIVFGPATTMTSDGPLQHRLHQTMGGRWINEDVESETGGGVVPALYREGNPINATMWLTGLELFLLLEDPWRVFLTTDHPNAGVFTKYPQVVKLLMDADYRNGMLAGIHRRARKGALLAELDREYSLNEIAIISRAGPARALGLSRKGHLGPGADADIAVYREEADKEAMFARPRYVFKGGTLVAKDGEVTADVPGRTLYVAPDYDASVVDRIRAHFRDSYTVSFENYLIEEEELGPHEVIPCR
ncbi:MAG: hypothetical protein Kow00129_10970 [Thermoleophilia bacterium]